LDSKTGKVQEMSEKPNAEKKPILEPIDEINVTAGKNLRIEKIVEARTYRDEFALKRARGSTSRVPTMKAHYAIVHTMFNHQFETLKEFDSLIDSFIDMYRKVGVALDALEKQIQELSEKTGIEVTQIKSEVAKAREAAEAPINKYLREQKEADKTIHEKGEVFFDQATRSH
jgi:hypothetical protein